MNEACRQELEIIRKLNNGFLRPQDVVEFARSSNTALHKEFTWDDTEAATKYRLSQAAAIIRVAVIVEPASQEKTRTYVSLTTDRKENLGYRSIVEVMNDDMLKDVLLADALKELQAFKRKYEKLLGFAQLDGVFQEIEKATSANNQEAA